MLGTSETPSVGPELFAPVDKRARLYRRLGVEAPASALPPAPRAVYRPVPLAGSPESASAPAGGPPEDRLADEAERVHQHAPRADGAAERARGRDR